VSKRPHTLPPFLRGKPVVLDIIFARFISRRQRLHLFVGQTTCLGENGQWIASERPSGKNIKLNEIVAGSHVRKYLLV
jgi:hypothetical protein